MDVKEYNQKWCPLIKDSNVFLDTIEQNIQKSDTPEEVLMNFKIVGWRTELKDFLKKAVSVYQESLIRQAVKDEMPICGDCLCRVCANSNCQGCDTCTGVVETEDDCFHEFVPCGDD